jgi:hypothetical protein
MIDKRARARAAANLTYAFAKDCPKIERLL